MLGIELQQTRVYQEAEQYGRQEEAQGLILRLLNRRVGKVSLEVEERVKILPLLRLEELHDAALDFTLIDDLLAWLDANR
jgi:predicted transposase YdaD